MQSRFGKLVKVCPRCFTRFPDGERFCLHDSAVLVEEEDIARLGHNIGNYRLDKILGRGGMGTVYFGEHVYIKKPGRGEGAAPAVRALPGGDPPLPARGARGDVDQPPEHRRRHRLRHPAPRARCTSSWSTSRASRLEDLIEKEGAVELHRALNIANQIALALDAAHAVGVIHRDLKPDNIMLLKRPGRRDLVRINPDQTWITEREESYDFVKVLDFGIAKVLIQDELMAETVQGAVFGTPEYMSPEAARGEDVDHRADVYSLGVILFDMLCGRPPFEAPQSSEVLSMHIHSAAAVAARVRAAPRDHREGRGA